MKKLENNSGMALKTNPRLSEVRKALVKQAKPSKLIALKRALARKATKTQLKSKMHSLSEFKDASSMGLSDKFPFGKHKDRTLRYIVKTDPMWLVWILDNMGEKIRLNSEVMKHIEMFVGTQVEDDIEGAQVELEEYGGGLAVEDTF